jgi:hypothetical protein
VDSPTRLETFADIDDEAAHAQQMSVSLRHEAVLESGRRVPLLEGRGWSTSMMRFSSDEGSADDASRALTPPDPWATTVEDIIDTARVVVGPDEPSDGHTYEDAAADHWAALVEVLRQQGTTVDAAELSRLPHDVVLSDRLLSRIGHDPG